MVINMKWTGLNEIREKYLAFFESKSHLRLSSFSLVPHNDKSLFLINSGMAPMKKFFLGQETPPNKRVTTCQKCIRTPDIENVGKTARHGTYFEMLGNFSFGDYFKVEAIKWAWEFFTEVMELPKDKLYISVYLEDDEAYDIWTKQIGIEESHMTRMGKEDNFWEHGSGPCGPCSEIYFDRGDAKGCGSPDCKVGCECDRFVEVWNLVFSQFDSDGNGTYTLLEHPNIDTGMGLERLACVMQQVDNLFEVDTMQKIMKHISDIAGVNYKDDDQNDVSLRVITDHIRSTTFMICDGVVPSNEGRGYVLRRLLRRAARHGRLLGIVTPFLSEVVNTVVSENKQAYPELENKLDYIKRVVKTEEDNFAKTIGKGFELLNKIIDLMDDKIMSGNASMLSGEDAFKLYDTYGFPIDLTREIVAEKNMLVDEEEFLRLMNEQRVRARNARSTDDAFGFNGGDAELDIDSTVFVGYDQLKCDAKILHMALEGESVSTCSARYADETPQKVTIITDITPFYAESGGQVADIGQIISQNAILNVVDVRKNNNVIAHSCVLISGDISIGDSATMKVDKNHRNAVMRNHTCAHLLQAALINTLGSHVHQAGQLVNAEHLRFDFSHFEAVSREQLEQIERDVNKVIMKAMPVLRYETDINTAREKGAMALFGEKYGEIVRVCEVGDYSLELCGGTHVDNSSKIGLFKIISESSVAAGVRRIEAVTGMGVLALLENNVKMINDAAVELKLSNPAEIVTRCEQVMTELKAKTIECDSLSQKIADAQMESLFPTVQPAGPVNYITAMFSGTTVESLRLMGDRLKEKGKNAVGLLVGVHEGKATMLCVCGTEAINNGAHAGKIVSKAAAITGGKGGGKADVAMAGVGDNHKIDEAFDAIVKIITEVIGS